MTTYSVHLIDDNGIGSYLSVKDKTSWKTKQTAMKHAKDISCMIDKRFGSGILMIVEVENEFGEVLETFTTRQV